MDQFGLLIGKDLFSTIQFGTLQSAELPYLFYGKEGKKHEEFLYICIRDIPPILVILKGRKQIRIKEYSALLGLSHFFAVGTGNKGKGKPEDLIPRHSANQLHTGDNITPLVIPSNLEEAVLIPIKYIKIIGLKELIVEFDKTESRFQAFFIGFEGEHPVYRKMPPDIA